jgi:FkbM family methyltransferase
MTLSQDKSNRMVGHLVRAAVRLGLGRGRLKHVFAKAWQVAVGTGPVDVVYHGIKLRLFPVGNTIESKILFSSRRREGKELDALAAVLSNGGVFFDIGANIGYYSMMAAKFGAGAVCAVEANPDLAERCQRHAETNGFGDIVRVVPCALGGAFGTARLYLGSKDLGSSSIVKPSTDGGFLDVEMRPLLDVVQSCDVVAIDAMKIDVEGMESQILKPFFESAAPSLYPKMMIIEDSSQADWDWHVVDWMLANGYQIKDRSRGNLILTR